MNSGSDFMQAGYTAIELLAAVGIIAMMATAAVPSFVKRLPNQRLGKATWQVYMDLQQARMKAVSENVAVQVAFDGSTNEYMIWADANDNGVQDAGETETRLLGDIAGLSLTSRPASATFKPAGTVEPADAYYHLSIRVYVQDAGYRYVYAYPNGFIDGHLIQEGS